MLSFRDIASGLKQLDLDHNKPVIVHASLRSFGEIRGGAETLLGTILLTSNAVMMPAFTFQTMVTPSIGPENNGITYGSDKDGNLLASAFHNDMPAHPLMGILAETLRHHTNAKRSNHPILSFTGINLTDVLDLQSLQNPLAPIQGLMDRDGWVLLMGVNHTCNTSIHLAEKLAGRKPFTRWAINTSHRIVECPGFPGCSDGFDDAENLLRTITREVKIGDARVRALPVRPMVEVLTSLIADHPLAMLCARPACERCEAVRTSMRMQNFIESTTPTS